MSFRTELRSWETQRQRALEWGGHGGRSNFGACGLTLGTTVVWLDICVTRF